MIEYENRKILIDVDCDTMPGFELYEFEMPVKVFESYGVNGSEITDVIITYSYNDHIDVLYNYMKVTVRLHKKELKPAGRYITDEKQVSTFDECIEILDKVEIRHIDGHSAGSSVVLVDVGEYTYTICGDEWY